MTEQATQSTPEYRNGILDKDEDTRFIYRVLEQVTFHGFSERDLISIETLGQALNRQLQTLNHPYVWDCIFKTYEDNPTRDPVKASATNQPFIDNITEIAINGIVWGTEQFPSCDYTNEPIKAAFFKSISPFANPVDSLEQFVARTELVFGNLYHPGLLEESLVGNEEVEITSDHRALMDVMRIYGKGFSPQFQEIA